jgi:hypothetical protein
VFLSPQLFDQLEDKQEINLPEYLKNSKFHKASSCMQYCCCRTSLCVLELRPALECSAAARHTSSHIAQCCAAG